MVARTWVSGSHPMKRVGCRSAYTTPGASPHSYRLQPPPNLHRRSHIRALVYYGSKKVLVDNTPDPKLEKEQPKSFAWTARGTGSPLRRASEAL